MVWWEVSRSVDIYRCASVLKYLGYDVNEPAVRMTIKPVCSRALYEVSAENGRSQMLFLLIIKPLLLILLSF